MTKHVVFYFLIFGLISHSFSQSISDLERLKKRISFPAAAGHRGDFYGSIPNTMRAFESGYRKGLDIVEMDLRISKDGIPMVFHDDTLNPTTYCRGPVYKYTKQELQKCKFPFHRDAYIPTFEEVLIWSHGKIVVDAEFKDAATIKPALDLIKKYNAYSWVYFQTQDNKNKYWQARQLDEMVPLLFAVNTTADLDWALSLNDPALIIIEIVPATRTPQVIEAVHNAGKLVTEDTWHFSKVLHEFFGATCKQAYSLNIDIPVTNRPSGCVNQRNSFY